MEDQKNVEPEENEAANETQQPDHIKGIQGSHSPLNNTSLDSLRHELNTSDVLTENSFLNDTIDREVAEINEDIPNTLSSTYVKLDVEP